MKKLRELTFLTQLALGLGLSLIVVGAIMGVGNYFVSTIPLERRMCENARLTCAQLAETLREPVWNMDDRALAAYFGKHPWQLSNLVSVRILTEFGDPIFEQRMSAKTNVHTCRQAVTHDGRTVGYIEVSLGKGELTLIRTAIARASVMIIVSGIAVILLVTILLTRAIIAVPARRLRDVLARIEQGDYTCDLPHASSREVEEIFHSVNVMARRIAERTDELTRENSQRRKAEGELRRLTESLEKQVQERTLELQTAYHDLQRETEDRRQVQHEILAISDRERESIGRDLHDSLGQQLTGLALLLAVLHKSLDRSGSPHAATAAALRDQMKAATAEARTLSHGLMPLNLRDGGFTAALQALVDGTTRMYGCDCRLMIPPEFTFASDTVAINTYRIVQEAIHNAHRHGEADRITIRLSRTAPDAAQGELVIEDTGKGFDHNAPPSDGMGLRIMRYRAESMGGTLTISANASGGTTIRATFVDEPSPKQAEESDNDSPRPTA